MLEGASITGLRREMRPKSTLKLENSHAKRKKTNIAFQSMGWMGSVPHCKQACDALMASVRESCPASRANQGNVASDYAQHEPTGRTADVARAFFCAQSAGRRGLDRAWLHSMTDDDESTPRKRRQAVAYNP